MKNRRRKDKFAVFTLFWPFLLFITYLLRIHHNYDKKDPHAITNRLRVHLPIFGNKTLDVDLGEKEKYAFHFRLEIFDLTFEPFSTTESGYDTVGQIMRIANTSI